MQALFVLALAGASSASVPLVARSSVAFMALPAVFERQVDVCKPVPPPYTCEHSCGAGYVECIAPPTCYNPGLGESCCSNGKYCPKGYYCTNAGCCPDGTSLEECGATVSLSVIPPPSTKTSSKPAPPTSTPVEPTTSSKAESTSSKAEPTTSSEGQATSSSEVEPTTAPGTSSVPVVTVPCTTAQHNGTTTAISPPIVTAGSGRNVAAAVVGLGALVLAM